jgi:hypothetical protein
VGLLGTDSLLLPELVMLVRERCDCSEEQAEDAVRRAGLDARFEGDGTIHLSAHPDPAFRVRHGVPTRGVLRPGDWSSEINWGAGTVGRYFSVSVKRVSVEAWLARGGFAPPVVVFKKAADAVTKKAIRDEYTRAKINDEKPPNVRQIVEPVQRALQAEGFEASGNRIQESAASKEFEGMRRKPGATIKNEKDR